MPGISAPVDNTSYLAFLKKYYIGKKALYQLDSYKTPLVGLLSKDLGAGGSTWEQTIGVTNVQGGSNGSFATAYANSTQGVDKVFSGGYKKRFADVKIQDFTLQSSRNADGGIEKAGVRKVNTLKDEFLQTINFQIPRDEGGSYGQLAATDATGSVIIGSTKAFAFTDSSKGGVQYLKPGKILDFGANLDGSSLHAGTNTVVGRNVFAGTFTMANAGPATGSDYVFEDGSAGLALAGFQSWCPLTDTLAATTFKTVDRSIDVNGLGGIRVGGVGDSMEELLTDAVSAHRQLGGDPDIVAVHPKRYAQLRKELSGRIRFNEPKGKPLVGGSNSFCFKGIEIDAGGRPVTVIEDACVPTAVSWVIDTKVIFLRSMDQWPRNPMTEVMQLLQGTDVWQSQLFAYLEVIVARPASLLAISHDASIS